MSENSHLRIIKQESDGKVIYFIEGVLDETVDLKPLQESECLVMQLNLRGLIRISSLGVREWTNVIKKITIPVELYDCSPCVISQVNIIREFLGKAVIKSILIPYVCNDCGEEFLESVKTESIDVNFISTLNTSHKCTSCNHTMEFADDEETYFDFLHRDGKF